MTVMRFKKQLLSMIAALLLLSGCAGTAPGDSQTQFTPEQQQQIVTTPETEPAVQPSLPSAETERTEQSAAEQKPSEPVLSEPLPELIPKPDAITSATAKPETPPESVGPEQSDTTQTANTCTISIRCDTILEHLDTLRPGKEDLVPADGWLLKPLTVEFNEGESVFHILRRVCKQQKLHMEFADTPVYNSAYIEGIGNLYEFDCGELSGWKYRVNGCFPNVGCSQSFVQSGDVIEWLYTCDLGADLDSGEAP